MHAGRVAALGAVLFTLLFLYGAQAQRAAPQVSAYTGAAACKPCHEAIALTYAQTGMGRSFSRLGSRLGPGTVVEAIGPDSRYFHAPSATWFAMIERQGNYFQRQYQIGFDGRETNLLEKAVDWVVGSGNHSRTYLSRAPNGHLVELPLAWYSEGGGSWAMNPGYDRPDHLGMRRQIKADCMFCHNAYPAGAAADGVFPEVLPEGIDCERCHGPGRPHVEAASRAGTAGSVIRGLIVNPKRLPSSRQAEVCLQCHLETTSFPLPNSMVRYERGPFSYRPGENIADFKLFFEAAAHGPAGPKFEIAGASYDLKRSKCVLKTGEALTCATCHNPHDIKHGAGAADRYNAVCTDCHAAPFRQAVAAGRHTSEGGCIGCHMPKRRTEDVVHVSMTDHHIQRVKPAGDLLAELAEQTGQYRGEVKLYYPAALPKPEDEIYLATAQVVESSNLDAGIPRLAAAIARFKPQRSEHYLQLADALRNAGRCPEALKQYEEARQRDPRALPIAQKSALCLESTGDPAGAAARLQAALTIHDSDAQTWVQLGLLLVKQGQIREGVAAFQKAIARDAELPEAWNSLGGVLLEAGQFTEAETALRNAIRLEPNYAVAHGNLGTLFTRRQRFAEAAFHYEAALRYQPDSSATRRDYAVSLAQAGRMAEAQLQLEESLQGEPESPEGHQLLGVVLANRGRTADALVQYREAVRLRADFQRANLSVGQSLAGSGDVEAALPYLQKAAQGADRTAAAEAAAILRQLNRR